VDTCVPHLGGLRQSGEDRPKFNPCEIPTTNRLLPEIAALAYIGIQSDKSGDWDSFATALLRLSKQLPLGHAVQCN